MDARPKTLAEILQTGTDQYRIPFFQRNYKWTRKEWERLWLDLIRLGELQGQDRHFMGSMVCTPLAHVPGEINAYQLIDGQQRLTTLAILLTAVREFARALQMESLEEQIYEGFLVHKWHKGNDRFRVVPRTGDREVLFRVIERETEKPDWVSRITKAHRYFYSAIEEHLNEKEDKCSELKQLFSLITARLLLVVITIDDENPYEIFWSLNGKGLPLRQSDLVRNYVFMQVPLEEQESFNETHWNRLEDLLGETESNGVKINATRFYRNYLMRGGKYFRKENTFLEFKSQYEDEGLGPYKTCEELIYFAGVYGRILDPCEDDAELCGPFSRLKQLDQATCHPLIMALLSRFRTEGSETGGLLQCLAYLESYILRRSMCGESTRSYGKLFVEAISSLADDCAVSLKEFLLNKQWPDDEALLNALDTFDVYRRERKMTLLMLCELERECHSKEVVDLTVGITIEHVMPQNIESGPDAGSWRETLGGDWKELHQGYIHRLGNLTLTGYNSELSNSSYKKKRSLFEGSKLELNRYFRGQPSWDIDAIDARGQELAARVARIWTRPDGVPYRSAKVIRREEKRFLPEFWGAFLEVSEHYARADFRQRQLGRDWLEFPSARRIVRYYIQVFPEGQSVEVGVFCRGRRGEQFMDALWEAVSDEAYDELYDIHGSLAEFYSEDKADGEFAHICLEKSGFVIDRIAWPEPQKALDKILYDFVRMFEPLVQEVGAAFITRGENSWRKRVGAGGVGLCQALLALVQDECEDQLALKYQKRHVPLIRAAEPNRTILVIFPKTDCLRMEVHAKFSEELRSEWSAIGIAVDEVLGGNRVRFNISNSVLQSDSETIARVLGNIVASRA